MEVFRRPVALCWISTAKLSSELSVRLGGNLQGPRLLRLVGVAGAAVNLELANLLAAQLRLREHAAHGLFDEPLGILLLKVAGSGRPQAAGIARVAAVHLGVELRARQPDLVRVGHDHEVTHVEVGDVVRAVLAHDDPGDPGRQTTQNLAGRVHHEPAVANVGSRYSSCARSHFEPLSNRLSRRPAPRRAWTGPLSRARKNTQADRGCQQPGLPGRYGWTARGPRVRVAGSGWVNPPERNAFTRKVAICWRLTGGIGQKLPFPQPALMPSAAKRSIQFV